MTKFRMRREKRRAERELEHWQGVYRLPRIVRRALRKPLAPLLLSTRTTVKIAVDVLLTLIGRYHTAPRTFETRACGLGPDGGFLLDRRALSSSKAPEGCSGLTEWSVRQATEFLIDAGIIVRVSAIAGSTMTDALGRTGRWLKAKKRKGSIKAPPVRYRLSRTFCTLFSKTLGYTSPPKVRFGGPPVGEITLWDDKGSLIPNADVSTGGRNSSEDSSGTVIQPASPVEEWLNQTSNSDLIERIEAARAEKQKAYFAELRTRPRIPLPVWG